MAKNVADWIALILLVIGGLNWGLVAIDKGWNVIDLISGGYTGVARVIYGLVGLAALYSIFYLFKE